MSNYRRFDYSLQELNQVFDRVYFKYFSRTLGGEFRGNITMCTLELGNIRLQGFAYCSHAEKNFNKRQARQIAIGRALKQLGLRLAMAETQDDLQKDEAVWAEHAGTPARRALFYFMTATSDERKSLLKRSNALFSKSELVAGTSFTVKEYQGFEIPTSVYFDTDGSDDHLRFTVEVFESFFMMLNNAKILYLTNDVYPFNSLVDIDTVNRITNIINNEEELSNKCQMFKRELEMFNHLREGDSVDSSPVGLHKDAFLPVNTEYKH